MDENILEELTLMRKELQNIRVILQDQFVKDYNVKRERIDGKVVKTFQRLEDPLGDLRKRYNIDQ